MAKAFLEKIVDVKKRLNAERASYFDRLRMQLAGETYNRYRLFKNMISKPGRINLIAEIKKSSPSKGLIRVEFDVLAIARAYAEGGADAISVLTEEKYFLGKPSYIKKVSEEVPLPLLTKDFIIDEGQIYEARFNGASAILLIVAILTDDQLRDLKATAEQLDMDCLIEVHNEEELERALQVAPEIIGVNNRNLHTFDVDMTTTLRLIPRIPGDVVIVAESGYANREDILTVYRQGAHAVLIGERFMREDNIKLAMRKIIPEKASYDIQNNKG